MTESFFASLIDELVESADQDPELADGIRWLDEQAQRRGVTIYDMAFEVLYRHGWSAGSAGAWLRGRN